MVSADPTGQLADQLMALTRRLHRAQRRQLGPIGITPAQARLLRTVSRAHTPPRMADLAAQLDVVPRAITSLVDGLETPGLVRRAPDPSSRRVTRIELTEEGTALIHRLRRARRSATEELLDPLSREQRGELSALLALLEAPQRDACPRE